MARKETVTEVLDGDTFRTANRKNPIRLADVDAPEKGEPGAKAATEALRNLIEGKEVSIDTRGRSYGRSVARVKVNGRSVNKAMKNTLKK